MEKFIETLKEILEVESIDLGDELESFDVWDSLTILSIISFILDDYEVALSADEISNCVTIKDLIELVEIKQ